MLRQFGVRFAVCLVLLGTGYLIIFGLPGKSHNKPATPPQKLATLKAALNESYLAANALASFHQNDAKTFITLDSLTSAYQSSTNRLFDTLKAAPKQLSSTAREKIATVADRQKQLASDTAARLKYFNQVISYDPSEDLGDINPVTETQELLKRATAAQNGFKKSTKPVAATNDSLKVDASAGGLADQVTKQALVKQADCFGQLASQLEARQTDQATRTRSRCIIEYPQVRQLVIKNIVAAFTPEQQKYLQATVPPLLRELDGLIEKN